MRKDIEFPTVEGVQVAITQSINLVNEAEWEVYLLNYNTYTLHNVLVTSRGYSPKDTKEAYRKETSTLRQMLGSIEAEVGARIELIDPALFSLCNEYWISYYVDDKIYDKKFIFMPDSITEKNLVYIDILNKKGVLHS